MEPASFGYPASNDPYPRSSRPSLARHSVVGALAFGALLPLYFFDRAPDGRDLLLFLGMGAVGAFSHFLFSLAYKLTPASQLAPLNYVQLLSAGLLGWLAFGQFPGRTSLLGMAVILASGIVAALRSRPTIESAARASG